MAPDEEFPRRSAPAEGREYGTSSYSEAPPLAIRIQGFPFLHFQHGHECAARVARVAGLVGWSDRSEANSGKSRAHNRRDNMATERAAKMAKLKAQCCTAGLHRYRFQSWKLMPELWEAQREVHGSSTQEDSQMKLMHYPNSFQYDRLSAEQRRQNYSIRQDSCSCSMEYKGRGPEKSQES